MKKVNVSNISYKINENKLFHNISFDIKKGEALHISGPNGSGKSTLLRIIIGITLPTKGSVKLYIDNDVCYLGHKNSLKNYLTVEDNILIMGLKNNPKLNSFLEKLGLSKHLEVIVSNLSFGQQKKLALLRVLLNNSDLIVLDEPFVGLDDDAQSYIIEFLKSELEKNKSIIFTSHINCSIESNNLKLG